LLDGGALQRGIITKILTGGRGPIPVVDVDLYGSDAQVPGLINQPKIPQRPIPKPGGTQIAQGPAPTSGSKPWRWIGLAAFILILIWVLART
jgi:hypothetical protein